MSKKVYLGPDPVLFGSSDCPACLSQVKMIKDHLKHGEIVYYDLRKNEAPRFITEKDGSYSMPTWVFPNGKIQKGVISDKNKFKDLVKKGSNFGPKRGKNRFGSTTDWIPQLGTLAKYGKNWSDNQGMQIPNSFMNTMEDRWGKGDSVLNAGTVGRELGPENTSKIFSQDYFYKPRMAQPGGQLGTALALNRNCNTLNNPEAKTKVTGLFGSSENQQIVGFGKKHRKNRFGGLQMGPAYGPGYIVGKETVNSLYGGALQNETKRPTKIQNPMEFIGSAREYKEFSSSFGLRKKPKTRIIKEGTVLTIKKGGKIKVKN